eukprot:COSAG02_NODE_20757_length_805_cov_11.748954_1_plen_74_part_01
MWGPLQLREVIQLIYSLGQHTAVVGGDAAWVRVDMSTTMERQPLATTSEPEHDGPEPEPEPLAAVQPPENPPDG